MEAAATLELELELGGAGGQRLLPAGPGAENESEAVASVREGRGQSVLRWFTTVVLCAAFLGLVRAGPKPCRPRRPAGNAVSLVPCAASDPWCTLLNPPGSQFCHLEKWAR